MKEYKEFVHQLQIGLKSFLLNPKDSWKEVAIKYVDGLAADELRRLIPLEKRREHGAFFTNSILAKQVLAKLGPRFDKQSIIYDPACGAGNLLISAYDIMHDLNIISQGENQLLGTDIHAEFIEAATLRLKINVLLKEPENFCNQSLNEKNKFDIMEGDGLLKNKFYEMATHIVVNPPFSLMNAPSDLNWAKGKVSAAGVFIDRILQNINPRTSIIAILPDVLRSGSRYEKWRKIVQETCIVETVNLLGQFDKFADVDVFALKLIKRARKTRYSNKFEHFQLVSQTKTQTIGDLFDVCVGPVVDNRDPKEGVSRGYIVSKGLEGWSEKSEATIERKHGGKSFYSPFIVVKRTSRMSDSSRAIATIINMPEPVYVDNHLIILKPKSESLADCQKAISILKDKRTDDWLNQQIRCRHLTVKVVSKIPMFQKSNISI